LAFGGRLETKEPWISDFRRYRCMDYEVVEESDCTRKDLKEWYDEQKC
jgi:hypothetical protein